MQYIYTFDHMSSAIESYCCRLALLYSHYIAVEFTTQFCRRTTCRLLELLEISSKQQHMKAHYTLAKLYIYIYVHTYICMYV